MPITRLSEPALAALTATPGLTIHSVFDSAVNLRAGPRLITCTSRRLGAPHGVEMTRADLHRLRDYGREQPAATLHWNTCRSQIANATGELAIRPAPDRTVFDPTLPVAGPSGWEPGVAALVDHLAREGLPTGFGADWVALIEDGRLCDAVTAITAGRVDDAVLYWLGRGVGLTPTGDDVLVGVLAALWSTGRLRDESMAALRPALEAAARARTNEVSAEYLYYACRGMAADPLRSLLATLRNPGPPALTDAVDRLRSYGHTSGMDLTLGVIAALR